MRRLAALSPLLASLALAGPAFAEGDPIMPLSQVHAGMRCTGFSVVRGTDIASFDVEILDVVAGDAAARQAFLLIRVSGPAVDATGLGPGFSGSPIYCPGDDGVLRNAGAVSEGVGDYGNDVGLATPIEAILGEPVDPPAETRYAPATVRSARPLATPLTFSGLSPQVGRVVQRAAAKAKRLIYATPGAPVGSQFPVQTMRPGSAMAVSLASGDVTSGAIGTVSYVDGDKVWGFGHPLDNAGRRSLFLQDAYVYAVIGNPVGSPELQSYKYAASGHDVGILTNDGVSAVVGRLGVLPTRFPLKLVARDLDTNALQVANVQIADETPLGLPTGTSALTEVGSIAVAELAFNALHGAPLRQSGSMCLRISLRESTKPLRFCNTYVGGGPADESGVGGGPLVADFASATGLLDTYNFGPLHVTGVEVDVKLRRSLRLAYVFSVSAPSVVRRGRTVKVKVRMQRQNGLRFERTISVHVPKGMPAGERDLTITGTPPDLESSPQDALTTLFDITSTDSSSDESGPRSVAQLRRAIKALHRSDGVTASFAPPGGSDPEAPTPHGAEGVAQRARRVYRDAELRISGSAHKRVLVVP